MNRIIIIIGLFLFVGCSENSPISAIYKIKNSNKYAVVLDSTMYLISGYDTSFVYTLSEILTYRKDDTTTLRGYNLKYNYSATRDGCETLECKLKLTGNPYFGGIPMALFCNDNYFILGDYEFKKDTSKFLFDNWISLVHKEIK